MNEQTGLVLPASGWIQKKRPWEEFASDTNSEPTQDGRLPSLQSLRFPEYQKTDGLTDGLSRSDRQCKSGGNGKILPIGRDVSSDLRWNGGFQQTAEIPCDNAYLEELGVSHLSANECGDQPTHPTARTQPSISLLYDGTGIPDRLEVWLQPNIQAEDETANPEASHPSSFYDPVYDTKLRLGEFYQMESQSGTQNVGTIGFNQAHAESWENSSEQYQPKNEAESYLSSDQTTQVSVQNALFSTPAEAAWKVSTRGSETSNSMSPPEDSNAQYEDSSAGNIEMQGLNDPVVEPKVNNQPRQAYDTCFGVIKLKSIPSGKAKAGVGESQHTFVRLQNITGGLFKLYDDNTSEYSGLLESVPLEVLLRDFDLTLSNTLISEGPQNKGKDFAKPQVATLEIIIYGIHANTEAVGDFLAEHGLYLQHPHGYDSTVLYVNPQYLLPPGGNMPDTQTLSVVNDMKQNVRAETLEESEKIEFLQIFNHSEGPTDYMEVSQSSSLRTPLKEHQKKALAMMAEKEQGTLEGAQFGTLWDVEQGEGGQLTYRHVVTRESRTQSPAPVYGGLLADEMGLGKTICVLALIAWHLDSVDLTPNHNARLPCSTLVVAPTSTLTGWQQQLEKHLHPGRIRAEIYHGSRRERITERLGDLDVVLTTYDTLRSDWDGGSCNSPLFSQKWTRVVLDEAHRIRNRSTQVFQAACSLSARSRWALTGTPIHNSIDDYGALLAFLRVHPFESRHSFRHWITDVLETCHDLGIQRLRRLVKATCLRRTKKSVQGRLDLPARHDRVEHVELSRQEREMYEFFEAGRSRMLAGVFSDQRSAPGRTMKGSTVTLINFLRRICDHGERLLPARALVAWQNRHTVAIDWAHFYDQNSPTGEQSLPADEEDFGNPVAEEKLIDRQCNDPMVNGESNGKGNPGFHLNVQRGNDTNTSQIPPPLCNGGSQSGYIPSRKVAALLHNLWHEQSLNPDMGKPVKSVIFSSWTGMLDQIAIALQNQFSFQRIDGQASLEQRTAALTTFHNESACTVLLASIGAIAEGVDLTAANYVHLVEPHWNPMVEEQALNRVHRIGQDRDVITVRYIVKNSVEEHIQRVQEHKRRLIYQSLEEIR